MRTYLECIPCFFKQALDIFRLLKLSEDLQKRILDEISTFIPHFSLSSKPPEMGKRIYQTIKKFTQIEDPLREYKVQSNLVVEKVIEKLDIPSMNLADLMKLSGAGNFIDFVIKQGNVEEKELLQHLRRTLIKSFQHFQFQQFLTHLESAQTILYIGDNAGEAVFDREVIRKFPPGKKVYFAVRGEPVINDVTEREAREIKMDEVAEIISTGDETPGVLLESSSSKFREIFHSSDLILAKGQGNYETLSEVEAPLFFLLQIKCSVVARDIKGEVGDIVLIKSSKFSKHAKL